MTNVYRRRSPIAAAGRCVARALERRRRVARGRQTLEGVLARLPGPGPAAGWRINGGHAASGSRVVFRVSGGDRPALVVKIGYTEADRRSLHAGARTLGTLSADTRLSGWRTVVPVLVADGELADAAYVVEEALPGAQPTWPDDPSRRRLAERAAELIGELHRATAEPMAGEALAEAWVGAPLRAIAEALEAADDPHRVCDRAGRLGTELSVALATSARSTSLVHGDYWPGNLLEADGRLTGVVDWDSAHRGPASVDLVHLLLHLRRGSGARSIGETAADVLVAQPWDDAESAVLARAASGSLDARATVLLWWLDFAAGNLARIPQAATSATWLARNVAVVLDAAEATG